MADKSGICELCGRNITGLTRHHLIPRSQHRRNKVLKRFSREQMLQQIALLCKPCHKMLHNLFSDTELVEKYFSISLMLENPDVLSFKDWIANKPDGFYCFTRKKKS